MRVTGVESPPELGYVGALMVWLFARVQYDEPNLAGEALQHATVHGGITL
ncbi:hypothetical protein [Streptomyces sp. NPDC058084]